MLESSSTEATPRLRATTSNATARVPSHTVRWTTVSSSLRPSPGAHLYVDESTSGDYLVICAVIASGEITETRAAMRGLLLPGQRSLHMKNERSRAPRILATVIDLDMQVLVYKVDRTVSAMEARRRCIQRLAQDACELGVTRVVLDRIDSVVDRDQSWLISGVQQVGHRAPPFTYHHQRRHEEPLLWIADAVGWAWARGGEMRALVEPVVITTEL